MRHRCSLLVAASAQTCEVLSTKPTPACMHRVSLKRRAEEGWHMQGSCCQPSREDNSPRCIPCVWSLPSMPNVPGCSFNTCFNKRLQGSLAGAALGNGSHDCGTSHPQQQSTWLAHREVGSIHPRLDLSSQQAHVTRDLQQTHWCLQLLTLSKL